MSQSLPMSPGIGYPADGPVELQRKIVWNTKYIADILAGAPPGPGDVVGPASSTNNALAIWDGTTGKLLKNSNLVYSGTTLTVPDAFGITSAGSVELTGGGTNENIVITPSGNSNGAFYASFTASGIKGLDMLADLGSTSLGLQTGMFAYGTNANSYGRLSMNRARGTAASPAELQNGDTFGAFVARGYFNGAFGATAEIDFIVDGAVTTNQRPPSRMEFYTNASNGAQTLAMTINASQNVLITKAPTVCSTVATPAGGSTSARLLFGTTAGFGIYYGSGAPSSLTAAQGSIYMRSDGGSTTRMYINNSSGSGTTWTAVNTVA